MGKRRRPAVERYYDRVAAKYDDSYDDAYWQWHDALTWDYIKPHLPTEHGATVLDLGCGTGKWAAKLSKSGYAVTCVDISAKMIDRARRKLAELNDRRAGFVQADLCELSALPSEGFALAVAMGDPIGCSASPPKALKEIHRVLRPNGVLIATFDNRLNALDFYMQSGDPKKLREFLRTGQTHWLTRDTDERFEIFTYTPAQVSKLVAAAGFEVMDMVGKTVLPMRDHRDTLLRESVDGRVWAQIEKSLCRDAAAMGRASHLQVVAKRSG